MTDTATTAPTSIGITMSSLLRADVAVLLRSRQTLLLNLVVPLIFVVVTSFGRRDFAAPGILLGLSITYGLMSAGMLGYALMVSRDREAGVFQRLRVTPTPTWAIMVSRIVVQLISALVMSIIVMIVGSLIHHVAFPWYQYVAALAVSLLGAAVFIALGQALVGLFRSATAVNAAGRVLYIVLILSGLLGTTGALGTTFQTFSTWTPVGAVVSLYAVAFGGAWSGNATAGIIAAPLYAIIFAFIGIRWFHWESR